MCAGSGASCLQPLIVRVPTARMGEGRLADALRRRAHTLRTRASEPSGIRLADKLLFCAGVTFIPVTEWVMIVHPYRFSYWYCPHART